MTLRLLLVESETEDVLFFRDVLEEMESSEYWSGWLHLDIFDAPTWHFAESILQAEPIDAILLSLKLADSQGADTYRRAQAAAPTVPVVLLIDEADVDLAERMVREGAQDFLVKKQVDCEPLAHALRNAIERQRLLVAARTSALTDVLTGLVNRSSFERFADRDRKIAERLHRRMAIVAIQPRGEVGDGPGQDLLLVESADRLRTVAGPLDLVARISTNRLAVSLIDTDAEPVEAAVARLRHSPATHAFAVGAAIFDPDRPRALEQLIEDAEQQIASEILVAHNREAAAQKPNAAHAS